MLTVPASLSQTFNTQTALSVTIKEAKSPLNF